MYSSVPKSLVLLILFPVAASVHIVFCFCKSLNWSCWSCGTIFEWCLPIPFRCRNDTICLQFAVCSDVKHMQKNRLQLFFFALEIFRAGMLLLVLVYSVFSSTYWEVKRCCPAHLIEEMKGLQVIRVLTFEVGDGHHLISL